MDSMDKINLVKFEKKNLKKTYKWIKNSNLRTLLDQTQDNPSFEDSKKWFIKNKEEDSRLLFAIYYGEEHVGNCGFIDMDDTTKKAKLWIYIGDKEKRGKGIGKKALIELINRGFYDFNLNRIYLYCLEENSYAIKLYKKVGFVKEGFLREHTFQNGEFKNCIFFGLLKKEWKI
jgi:diamine N-acetyltransferase